MTLSSETMMKLMAYADGELDGSERAEAEALVARDPQAAEFVASLGALGDVVRAGHEDRVASIESFDVADAVLAKIEGQRPADPPKSRSAGDLVSLEAARERRAQRMKIGAGVVAALAAAAAVVLVARGPSEQPMAKAPPAPAEPSADPGTSAAPAPSLASAGVEVDAVESPGHSVSVFYLPTANELSTSVVVWVDETGEQ